nr:MAG TPA: hypothetical protein [Microviridae sp.]
MNGLFYVPIYNIQNCNFLIYNHSGNNWFYISSAQVRLELSFCKELTTSKTTTITTKSTTISHDVKIKDYTYT